ncbi:MAG: SpoIID/LytB domain-containing protein [Lachnospiraceae bacterium]
MWKKISMGCLIGLLFPYIVTLAWTGQVEGLDQGIQAPGERQIILDRGTQRMEVDLETYLIGIVAKQIPADYGPEALKAQAIVARTYLYREMGDGKEIAESALDLDYLENSQYEKHWGREKAAEYYQNIKEAVESTAGVVMTYEDEYITPLFHPVNAGQTRAGDEVHPYLQPADSTGDLEAENYLQILSWTKEEFIQRINGISPEKQISPDQVPSTFQMVEKDGAGYVLQFQIGNGIYSGDEIWHALNLPSPAFTLEEYDGKVRAVCHGTGHGYGLSQYGAKRMAAEGKTAEEILNYFYKNIALISE